MSHLMKMHIYAYLFILIVLNEIHASSTYRNLFFSEAKEFIETESSNQKKFQDQLNNILQKTNQILVVRSAEWKSNTAKLVYYEKRNSKFVKVSDTIPVNLGFSGLGWGSGLIEFDNVNGPLKHERDLRAPAGIFSLSYAFGYLPKDSLLWLNYPYIQVTRKIECVDDSFSTHYNTLVDVDTLEKTWKTSEIMQRRDILYKYGISVDHNSNPRMPAGGSCIFIHIWRGFGKPTEGCTSLSEIETIKLLKWIDIKKNPILIQLPENEFIKIKEMINIE